MSNPTTRIGTPTSDTDRFRMRGKDVLSEIIGEMSFTEAFYFIVTGRELTKEQAKTFDACVIILMDQSKTSGVGNYVLSEVLYKARVYPWAACADLSAAEWAEVYSAASETLRTSYAAQAALALAAADDPVAMATAMRMAVDAGRLAYLAGRMPRREIAIPSSPTTGMLD